MHGETIITHCKPQRGVKSGYIIVEGNFIFLRQKVKMLTPNALIIKEDTSILRGGGTPQMCHNGHNTMERVTMNMVTKTSPSQLTKDHPKPSRNQIAKPLSCVVVSNSKLNDFHPISPAKDGPSPPHSVEAFKEGFD
jgi:hypothetical protein